MKYKAVIFDLDGTLVNSIEDIADAMNIVLKSYSYPTHSYETYQIFVGSGIKSLVKKALPAVHINDSLINTVFNTMMSVYRNQCTNKTKPYPGIIDLLDVLKNKQLKISILSNKADEFTKKIASTLFPDYFNPVLGLKFEAHKKPSPIVALQICKELQVKPDETLYVGDTSIDIQTALNANLLPVGVSWGFRDIKELRDTGAKHILNHPLDLIKVLQT
ncbi:HAD family hydrolase [Pseudalgibacter alginicilyticus]|uniref:phosphoglycolate phosphatase n=1 Tax=Pseudalgibacter alginicilyticus TaxID=1736674 RepID=A0A0P0CE57_9FLAO|nr:HAD family hydrolase [Pseudalgibacter alginicilyticus]ALJ04244.1 HAD family hydrolase [Pseudalgibacter alginicilyticus]